MSVTDTTGAGDAFHGAFALMLAEGRPVAGARALAAAVAALKCTRLGSRAGLPTRAELDAFLASTPRRAECSTRAPIARHMLATDVHFRTLSTSISESVGLDQAIVI